MPVDFMSFPYTTLSRNSVRYSKSIHCNKYSTAVHCNTIHSSKQKTKDSKATRMHLSKVKVFCVSHTHTHTHHTHTHTYAHTHTHTHINRFINTERVKEDQKKLQMLKERLAKKLKKQIKEINALRHERNSSVLSADRDRRRAL